MRLEFVGMKASADEVALIDRVRDAMGVASRSEAIRLAFRESAESRGLIPARAKVRQRKRATPPVGQTEGGKG